MELTLAATTASRVRPGTTVIVPVGSMTQHGPDLPLDTDTEVAVAVAESAAKMLRRRRVGVVVAPAVAYGCGPMEATAGTIAIDPDALCSLLVSLGRSTLAWADRVVMITASDDNLGAVRAASEELAADDLEVSWVSCVTDDKLSRRRVERSLMLHLKPWEVRADRQRGRLPSADDAGAATAGEGLEILDHMAWRVLRGVLDRAAPAPLDARGHSVHSADI